jgi:hypothetical protein
MNFLSKQALLRSFQIAQQIEAIPRICTFLLAGTNWGNHQKNWEKFPGLFWAPTDFATQLQTNFAAGQVKKR